MPPILSKPSSAARTAVMYITLGALMVVWTVVWYLYLNRHGGSDLAYFTDYGFFFTGLVLIVIGITIGRIGRSARHAELPPEVNKHEETAEPAVTAPQPQPTAAPAAMPPGYFVPPYPAPGVAQPAAPVQGGAVVPPVAQVAPPGPSPR
jgi:uncharacterized membrane protein YhdT